MMMVSVSVFVNQPLNVSKEDAVAGDLTVMLSAAIFVYTPLFSAGLSLGLVFVSGFESGFFQGSKRVDLGCRGLLWVKMARKRGFQRGSVEKGTIRQTLLVGTKR